MTKVRSSLSCHPNFQVFTCGVESMKTHLNTRLNGLILEVLEPSVSFKAPFGPHRFAAAQKYSQNHKCVKEAFAFAFTFPSLTLCWCCFLQPSRTYCCHEIQWNSHNRVSAVWQNPTNSHGAASYSHGQALHSRRLISLTGKVQSLHNESGLEENSH